MTTFELHPVLVKDCVVLGHLSFCQVLLSRDGRYPWLILVPQGEGFTDLDQLDEAQAAAVHADVRQASAALRQLFQPDKLNVAALGNMVPQLHIHVIARFRTDAAWPQPVWGIHPPMAYTEQELEQRAAALKQALGLG